MNIKKILFCEDGEPHTIKAEEYALTLARQCGAELVALYVVNPLLKKFTHEIYAVNRDECRAHLDRSLEGEGNAALSQFQCKASNCNIPVRTIIKYGPPEEVIIREAEEGNFDMVILGARMLRTWMQRFESCNLPEKIFKDSAVPVLFVK